MPRVTATPAAGRPRRRRRHRRLQGGDLLRRLTEAGHDVTGRPHARPRCVRRCGDLGGAVRPPGGAPTCGTTSHEVPHVRLGREADLVVVAPATADLLARAAHGLADDLLTTPADRPLPRALRARDAHRDVGAPGDPGQRRHPAQPRRASCSSPRPAGSPAPTPARAGCPSPTRSLDACRDLLPPRRDRRPTWPADASSSAPAAPASRSTRCGSSATAPPAGRATRWRRTRGAARRRGDARRGQRRAARPCRRERGPGRTAERAARRGASRPLPRRRRRRDGRRRRRLPPRRRRRDQDQEDRRAGCPPPVALVANPDVLAELVAATPGPGPGGRRVRRRDR